MQKLSTPVADETWGTFFSVVLGTWFVVWCFAALHDQYIIRIYPEHFTLYHEGFEFIENLTLLALAYSFGASVSPGLVLGISLFFVGRFSHRPKLSPRSLVLSTIWVFLVVEITAASSGWHVAHTGLPLYPAWMYPDQSRGLLITQTIQISTYLSATFFSLLLLGATWQRRQKLSRLPEAPSASTT